MVQVLGTANPEATVTVNQQPVVRQEADFARNLPVDNTVVDVYETVRIVGVKSVEDPNPVNYVSEEERDVFVPKTPEAFDYDDDGNLTQDGRWTYEWNGENRLTAMETRADLTSALPRQRLEFLYDADGRRIRKEVFEWDSGDSSFVPQTSTMFAYAGWNLLAETTTSGDLIRSYLWGPSETGQIEFTATPGALLGLRDHATNAFSFAQADGNGNIAALINSADGTAAARYEYGPFGEPLLAVGAMAAENPIRFSSKYADTETGLLYYGYRYYSPSMGRWLNRDPIEEMGGLNLYAFNQNDPINRWDYLGLLSHFDVAWQLASHWAAPNGSEPFLRSGGEWKEWAREFQTIRNDARTEYIKQARAFYRSGAINAQFHHRRAFPLDSDYWIRLSLNGIRYVINGELELEDRCTVVLKSMRHAILDKGDFDGRDPVDVLGRFQGWSHRTFSWSLFPNDHKIRYQDFLITIDWYEEDFRFIWNGKQLVPEDPNQWPGGF